MLFCAINRLSHLNGSFFIYLSVCLARITATLQVIDYLSFNIYNSVHHDQYIPNIVFCHGLTLGVFSFYLLKV